LTVVQGDEGQGECEARRGRGQSGLGTGCETRQCRQGPTARRRREDRRRLAAAPDLAATPRFAELARNPANQVTGVTVRFRDRHLLNHCGTRAVTVVTVMTGYSL